MSGPIAGAWPLAALWAAFLVGLAGGFGHCLGMCGPLVAAAALAGGAGPGPDRAGGRAGGRAGAVGIALWQAAYHGGRLLTYAAIGAALGAIGSLATVRGAIGPLQRWMWLATGLVMIVTGLAVAGVPRLAALGRSLESGGGIGGSGWFGRAFRRLSALGPWAALPFGMLNGLLPCGFLFAMQAAAVGSGSAAYGAALMLVTGLGTVAALAGFGAASGLIGATARAWLLRIGGAVVVAYGAYYAVRAAGVLLASPR